MDGAVRAYVGLGANLGDARATLANAAVALHGLPGTWVVARSSLYTSAPVDATGPDFTNAVIALETRLSALSLLRAMQRIEIEFGRERTHLNAPRTLDLDLLLWGTVTCAGPELVLPHPRMHLRGFVLEPLCELVPELSPAGVGPLALWRARAAVQPVHRLACDSGWGVSAL